MEYITLQEAIWKKLNTTSVKKHTRAQEKLYTLGLCKILENRWNSASDDHIKKLETNLYYTKNPQKEVVAIPVSVATLFLDKYILKAHQKYIHDMNKGFDEIYDKNPDMKRLSDEEIKQIQNAPSDSESEGDISEAESEEY